jgi:hypothetical protein
VIDIAQKEPIFLSTHHYVRKEKTMRTPEEIRDELLILQAKLDTIGAAIARSQERINRTRRAIANAGKRN